MRSWKRFFGRGQAQTLLAGLMTVVILGGISAVLGSWNAVSASTASTASAVVTVPIQAHAIAGYASFESSGQVNDQMTQGINDELQFDLDQIPDPDPGAAYYAWFLPDKGEGLVQPIPLGRLTVNHAEAISTMGVISNTPTS